MELNNDPCMEAQKKYCKEHKLPLFAYSFHTHIRSSYSPHYVETLTQNFIQAGYTLDKALLKCSSSLITGCPTCGATWCD